MLRVQGLRVSFRTPNGRLLPVIDAVNLTVGPNQSVGVVGESGSGKTMLCRSLIGTLQRHGAVVTGGRILLGDQDLAPADGATGRPGARCAGGSSATFRKARWPA